jgi:hypothetical protein
MQHLRLRVPAPFSHLRSAMCAEISPNCSAAESGRREIAMTGP